MDPLTHIVVGRAIVAVGSHEDRLPRGVAWSAVLGAMAPDVDSVVAFSGWDRYVRVHEFATHSIAGAAAMAALTAAVVGGVVRFRGGGTRFATLFSAATAGALSHLILDIVCGGRLRPGWPIVNSRVTVPLVAMADPWFVAICLAGLLGRWPAGLPWRGVSRAIVAAALLLLASKGAFLARAARSSPAPVSMTAVDPRWGSLTTWSIFERTPDAVRAWTIDGRGGPPSALMAHTVGANTPLVRASRSLETVTNFLSVHEFVFAIERPAADGAAEELWTDLRYCWATQPEDAAMVRAGESMSCAVWAGGLFDAGGRALTQLVKIGELVQTRPPR